MSPEDNLKTIKAVYEAFGRGDVASILNVVTEDVDWATEADSTAAPWWGPRRGKEAVSAFFQAFGAAMDVAEFAPLAFAANATDVLTVVRLKVKARATGKQAAMDLHHYFRFRDGKICYYRGTEDTAQTERVLEA
jgi:uncharacterized protein